MRAAERLWTAASAVVAAAVLLTACSGADETEEPTASASATGTSGDSETAADERIDLVLVPSAQMPDSWRSVNPADRIEGNPGKPRYCGVEVEPADVMAGSVPFYEHTGLPSYILEYGFVASEASATKKLDDLLAVADDCQDADDEFTRVPAEEIAGLGEQQVAWDVVRKDDPSLRSRAMVLRRGDTIVVLVAVGQTSVPVETQNEIAGIIDGRLAD